MTSSVKSRESSSGGDTRLLEQIGQGGQPLRDPRPFEQLPCIRAYASPPSTGVLLLEPAMVPEGRRMIEQSNKSLKFESPKGGAAGGADLSLTRGSPAITSGQIDARLGSNRHNKHSPKRG